MDKRWAGIIIILLVGLSCMYLIVTNSTNVGQAVEVVKDVTITLPYEFITTEDGGDFCVFFNKKTNETIRFYCLKNNPTHVNQYKNKLTSLEKDENIIIEKNFTNKTLSEIEFKNQTSKDNQYITVVYFEKCNHTFLMQMEHFTNETSKNNAMDYIIDTIKYDFKQKKPD